MPMTRPIFMFLHRMILFLHILLSKIAFKGPYRPPSLLFYTSCSREKWTNVILYDIW